MRVATTRPSPITGVYLQQRFAEIRQEVIGGLPWVTPVSRDGKASTFAARIGDSDVADIEPTMRRMLEHIRDGADGWRDRRMREPAFAFGAWMSQFTALREHVRGVPLNVADIHDTKQRPTVSPEFQAKILEQGRAIAARYGD